MGHHKNGMKSTRLGAFPDARGDALFSTVETVLETLTQNKLFKYFSRETIKNGRNYDSGTDFNIDY